MRGQHYKARDKTVRKMGRDGLTEENLRSGETVRISRRETDQLTLPKTADDSMNLRDRHSYGVRDKGANGRRRGGYSPDFKRPDDCGVGSTQDSLYQPDAERTDPYGEDGGEQENYGENMQGTGPDVENVAAADNGIREASRRQVPGSSSYVTSGRRKNYIPEPTAAHYRRNGETAQQGKDSHMVEEFPDGTSENTLGTKIGTTSDMEAAFRDTVSTAQNSQVSPSRSENIREQSARGSNVSGVGAESAEDNSHTRRKKQVYDHARKEKERRKTDEGKTASVRKEEERHTGNRLSAGHALEISQKDAEKKNDSRLHFGDEGGMAWGVGMRIAGKTATKAVALTSSALADDGADGQQEDMETAVIRDSKQAGERTFRYAMRQTSRRMQKRNRRLGEGIPETDRKKELRRFYQKQRVKKAYAEVKRGGKTAEGAAKVAGGFLGRAKNIAVEAFRNKKGLIIAAASILLVFLFFSAGISSCSAMVQGASSTFIGTTYPSEDEDIYNVEHQIIIPRDCAVASK